MNAVICIFIALLLSCATRSSATTVMKNMNRSIMVKFDCHSRDSDKPFERTGVPVQFIHVPKTGGNSVEAWLQTFGLEMYRGHSRDMTPMNELTIGPGQILAGNVEIGWHRFMELKNQSAFYFSITREPFDFLHSKFYYLYERRNLDVLRASGMKIAGFIATAAKAGYSFEDAFSFSALDNESTLSWFLSNVIEQIKYYVPHHLMSTRNSTDTAYIARCAVHFALHWVDALDDITHMDGLLEQLHFHAENRISRTKVNHGFPHKNVVGQQSLGKQNETMSMLARDKLMAIPTIARVYDAYAVFLKIGESRRAHAMDSNSSRADRNTPTCSITVEPKLQWLFEDVPEKCWRVVR